MTSTKEEIASYAGHSDGILYAINQLRGEVSLSDVTIIIGGRQFRTHKVILCASSSYFKAMFTSGFQEANKSEIKIEGDGAIFERLLEFIYTGKLRLAEDLIPDLISMASYFQFTHALSVCERFLHKCLRSKCISFNTVVHISNTYGPLGNIAQDYLAANLVDFSQSSVFKDISVADLKGFLDRNDLTALTDSITEDDVLKVVTSWLLHDWDDRKQHAVQLLRKVRLGVVSELFLVEQFTEQILSVPECKQLYEEVIQEQFKMYDGQAVDNKEMFAPRGVTLLMTVAKGIYGKLITRYFSMESLAWKGMDGINVLPMATPKWQYKSLYLDGHGPGSGPRHIDQIISAGNHLYLNIDLSPEYRSFYWYNTYTNKWNLRDDLSQTLIGSAWVCIGKDLYAIGGRCSTSSPYKNVVQRFHTNTGKWEDLPALPIPIDSTECQQEPVAIAYQGKLLVYTTLKKKKDGTRTRVIFVCFLSDDSSKCRWYCCPIKLFPGRGAQAVRLATDGERCYRVCYSPNVKEGKPFVNELVFNFKKMPSSVEIGRAHDQTFLPDNIIGAFRLGNEAYVNLDGLIYKLDITVSEDEAVVERLRKVIAVLEEAVTDDKPAFVKHTFRKFSIKLGLPSKKSKKPLS